VWLTLKAKSSVVDFGSLLKKCAYQVFITENLDIVTLELGMKVQFANF
jgi:hypothetical protein